MKNNLRSFLKNFTDTKILLYYGLIFSFFINILMLIVPVYSLQVLDRVISSQSLETLISLALITIFIISIVSILQIFRSMIITNSISWIEKNFVRLLLENISYKPSLENKNKIQKIFNDINIVKQFINSPAFTLLLDAPWTIIYFIILFCIHQFIGLLAVVSACLLLAISYFNYYIQKESSDNASNINLVYNNVIQNLNTYCTINNNILLDFDEKQKIFSDNFKKQNFSSILVNNLSKFIRLIVQILTTTLTAWLAITGDITIGAIIASSIIVSKALAVFEHSINLLGTLQKVKKSYISLKEVVNNNINDNNIVGFDISQLSGDLELNNLHLYVNKNALFTGINCKFKMGSINLIIGNSGSGKTLLSKIICGEISPNLGNIKYCDRDLKNYSISNLHDLIGYKSENMNIFSGSIAQNIAYFAPEINYKRIAHASEILGISNYILSLPQKYDTLISNNEILIPKTILQRIMLARAIYNSPKILILDQPLVNLDSEGERYLLNYLLFAKKHGVIIIIIGQDNSLLSIADNILILAPNGQSKFLAKDEFLQLKNQKQNKENIKDEISEHTE